jgi:hypothetical protein
VSKKSGCKNCWHAKVIIPICNENLFSTLLFKKNLKVKCAKGWWLDEQVREKQYTLLTVLKNGKRIKEAYKTCPYKDEKDER